MNRSVVLLSLDCFLERISVLRNSLCISLMIIILNISRIAWFFILNVFVFLLFLTSHRNVKAYILRLKQLERNLSVQKWLLQFFVIVVIHAQNIYYQLLLHRFENVAWSSLMSGFRDIIRYQTYVLHFCAFRWPSRVDYPPLQRNLISRKIPRRSLSNYLPSLVHSELFQYRVSYKKHKELLSMSYLML